MTEDEPPRETSVVTTVRIPRDHYDQLREIAAHEHRSMGGTIRLLVEQHISAYRQSVEE